jgi:hypothetical protein
LAGDAINQQVFIGGCSRSGTTLLGAMLGAHSDCICTPESHFKIDVLRARERLDVDGDLGATFNLLRKHWRFKVWELDIDPANLPKAALNDCYACLLEWVVSCYAQRQNRASARIWVDHTPENITYASTLLDLFPQAKIVHIVRDGRAVAASVMPLDWGPNTIIKAARWWMRMTSFGLAAETLLGPERIMRVKYEDLVLAPAETLQRLCAFLGMEYQPEMTRATGFKPPRYTNRQHTLIGTEPDARLATRWETHLSPRQIEVFENLTRNFLSYLGYPLQYGLKAKSPTFAEIQIGKSQELIRGEIINKIKWLKRSYPLWLSRDFYSQAGLSDTNN